MGAKPSFQSIQSKDAIIELDDERIYHPGDDITGTINIKRWDIQNEEVSVDLIGEIGYTVAFSSVHAEVSKDYDYHIPFFKVSTASIKHGDKFTLRLDEHLPPAVNLLVGTYPCIRYYLQINLSTTNQPQQYIIVCPLVTIPRSLIKSINFNTVNHKELHLRGTVDRDWALPGETLQINFQIDNPDRKHIRYIEGKIVMRGELTKADYFDTITEFNVANVGDTNEGHINNSVLVTIPSHYLPPTFIYMNDEHNFQVNISYWITIEMRVRGLFNSISTSIPLSIAFEPEKINFKQQPKPAQRRRITFDHRTKHNPKEATRRYTTGL